MPKQEGIVIKDWQKGMGSSALTGFYMLKNTDLSEPGLIRPNFTLAKESGSTITAQSVMAAVDPSTPANIYVLGFGTGTNATLYRSTDSGDTWNGLGAVTLTSSINPTAMAIWKGYLFVIGTKKIDVVKLSDLSTTLDWTTDALDPTGSYAGDSTYHPVLVGADDVLYIGNGRYMASVTETVGSTFAPGSSSTYILNAAALDLPADCRVRTLDWLNNRLLIGTWNGVGAVNARIYKWDTYSPSFESPVSLNEVAIKAGITVGNLYYFFAGGKCDLYVTDGNTAKFISHLPWQVLGVLSPDSTLDIKPQAVMYKGGKIYFGLISGAVATGNLRGLWSYDLNTGAFNYEQMISTSNDGNTNYLTIDWVLNYNGARHFVAWTDNGVYGVDQISTTRYGAYNCVIQTPLYQVGTKDNKRTFSRIEAQFARKFSSDQFRIGYRTNLTDSFTTISNLTTTVDNTLSLSEGCPLQDLENVQFQIELSNNASLIEVRVN